jgi:hypothetical protein
MTTNLRKLIALASIVLALGGALLAQDFSPKLRASIPFDFYAGGRVLPAGMYTISVNSESHNIAVRKDSGSGTFLFASQIDGSRDGRSFLVFRTNGQGTYVLEKIEGQDLGYSFPVEKSLSHLAADTHANEITVVATAYGR